MTKYSALVLAAATMLTGCSVDFGDRYPVVSEECFRQAAAALNFRDAFTGGDLVQQTPNIHVMALQHVDGVKVRAFYRVNEKEADVVSKAGFLLIVATEDGLALARAYFTSDGLADVETANGADDALKNLAKMQARNLLKAASEGCGIN